MSDNPMWRRYLRFWGPDVEADIRDELELLNGLGQDLGHTLRLLVA